MGLLIFKIVIIALLIRIIVLQFMHGLVIFWDEGADEMVKIIMKDPVKYVRDKHMEQMITNFIWMMIFISLLVSAFSGNVSINGSL